MIIAIIILDIIVDVNSMLYGFTDLNRTDWMRRFVPPTQVSSFIQ